MADTTYIVLKNEDSEGQADCWLLYVQPVTARSAEDAIRKTVMTNGEQATRKGHYVAVPARSWKPVQVEAVQTTVLKLT